jgi:type VI secretion system protein ImpM
LSSQALSPLAVFAFGKLPAHGDFVARGLAAGERDAWDAWATESLDLGRREFGEDFEAQHDSAPPWRFAFGPSRFANAWVAGALTPSIDRSGRRFVIVAGARAPAGALTPDGAGGQVAERLETEIYRVFETGGAIDSLVASAEGALAGVEPDAPSTQAGRFWRLDPSQALEVNEPPVNLLSLRLAT